LQLQDEDTDDDEDEEAPAGGGVDPDPEGPAVLLANQLAADLEEEERPPTPVSVRKRAPTRRSHRAGSDGDDPLLPMLPYTGRRI
jgi:hypothetical protein